MGAVAAPAEVSFESTVSNETPAPERKKAKAPETTVSLTQEEEVVSDLEKSPPSSFEDDSSKNKKKQEQIKEMNARVDLESIHDEDSSDDESSYFADPSNLPQPGSGRRYSWSSADHARMHMQRTQSDASLSLSDDSDDEQQRQSTTAPHHAHHHSDSNIAYYHTAFQAPTPTAHTAQPFMQPPPATIQQPMLHPSHIFMQGEVPEIFPQPIVRRHSISSLASTSSHNSEESDSSTSVRDELNNVATMERRVPSRPTPSGRRSPIMGEHAPTPHIPPFTSPSTVFGPSPPTILQAPYPGILPHPQPWTPEDRAAWAAAAAAAGAANSHMQYFPTELTKSTMSRESFDYSEMSGPSSQNRGLDQQQQQSRMRRTSDAEERSSRGRDMTGSSVARGSGGTGGNEDRSMTAEEEDRNFKVYWQRWIMLFVSSF